jgi:lysylphosphatidylglycerol synthetase-like protein (DUF2156 family)
VIIVGGMAYGDSREKRLAGIRWSRNLILAAVAANVLFSLLYVGLAQGLFESEAQPNMFSDVLERQALIHLGIAGMLLIPLAYYQKQLRAP